MTPDKQAQAGVHAPDGRELADLIETRLLGVAPDEQDLDLEDDDWRMILAALRTPPPAQRQVEAATNAEAVAAQERRRLALIERIGTIADLADSKPLLGELGDIAYDLLRQAAAQISSDRLHIARLASPPATAPQASEAQVEAKSISIAEEWSVYMDDAVSKAPEPLRNLGEFLADVLDEDHWKTAERYLNAAALSPAQTSAVVDERVEAMEAALEWYAEQVAGCRKIGSLGAPFQHALDADGGKRAHAALTPGAPNPGGAS